MEELDRNYIVNRFKKEVSNVDEIPENIRLQMFKNIDNSVRNIEYKSLGYINKSIAGGFVPPVKTIYLNTDIIADNKKDAKKVLTHESMHASSAEYNEDGEIERVGFRDYKAKAGNGLNEGVTEYYARKIYEKAENEKGHDSYDDLVAVVTDMITLYGNDAIIDAYINGPEKLEELMAEDGKSFTEFREIIDDYYINIYNRKGLDFNKAIQKPEVSGLYEKIGNFIEDIKKSKGLTQIQSQWKIKHREILDAKYRENYTINEMYTNFPYFEEKFEDIINNKVTFRAWTDDRFSTKLKLAKGLQEYKKCLEQIPYVAEQSDEIISKVLNNVENVRILRNVKEVVEYNESRKEILFDEGYMEDPIFSSLMLTLTKVAFKDDISQNNPFRGLQYERMQYIATKARNIKDGIDNQYSRQSDYSELISLFGEETMMKLGPNEITKITNELKLVNVSTEFFDAFNTLHDNNKSYEEQEQAKKVINKSLKAIREFRKQQEMAKQAREETETVQKQDNVKISLFQKLKAQIKRLFNFGKEQPLMLNESNEAPKMQEESDFLSSLKVDIVHADIIENSKKEKQINKEDKER